MVSALPVPPMEISPEMEVVLGAENRQQLLSLAEQQGKLLEKVYASCYDSGCGSPIHCPGYMKHWRAWQVPHISP